MSDLRNAQGEAGMWMRVYKGEQEFNDNSRSSKQQYTAIQGGYDKKTSRTTRFMLRKLCQ